MTQNRDAGHLIAGERVSSGATFASSPVTGAARDFPIGTPDLIDRAVVTADDAFGAYAATTREDRAAFLKAIAEELETRVDEITETAMAETGLPEPRIRSVELPRTANQMRLFARHIRDSDYLDRRHDEPLPDRKPMPRPDLRMIQRPIGPVAIFGASNFPLAFSTAGGDTAAALAAGCPVVVKGHEGHPGTAELAAEAIEAARQRTGMPAGAFSFVHGGDHAVGQALVRHPLIRAVGFTGSLKGGRALFDLCASREEPIPFFGELGSVNPIFVLPEASAARGGEIGKNWAGSLTMGAGQFCTNPGIVIVMDGPGADALRDAAAAALRDAAPQTMLTDGIAAAYREGAVRMREVRGVETVLETEPGARQATPFLFDTDAQTWLAEETLGEEVFGPVGLIVRCRDAGEMAAVARAMRGQLTVTFHMDDGDAAEMRTLLPLAERRAGRVLFNGFPTGVEVADAMVHGGPYPASTNFGATSVGTLAIRRFLRPVCYQDIPDSLLPDDLRA
ncbi:aldehyde dehydrogenase (NADP(+)) [Palleronia sp. LCG004]|uniref:aldehyde dehydrogenase (NADP(+)) n=1 Tax=Palleronia sp. LCG004 TaxID=3079304 RepID=UPI002943917E|nr:aldehyde dehydrogenase (NADP(+)) [Palleronia sp. LCG004]WOI56395.1 aldehyde dehydrogenase (NADP(+)) [Palleronia sp. LCG004]